MMRLLQTKWLAVALGTVIYAVSTWLCLQPQKQLLRAAEARRGPHETKAKAAPAGPSWTYQNPEQDQLLAELREQRESLRTRASQLDELEARLAVERQEIYAVTQTVYQLRADIDKVMTRIGEDEALNLKKLVKVYVTMSPEGAARIFKEMEDDQVVKLLALMREAESAPIIEALGQGGKEDSKRAASLSNRLRLMVVPPKKPAS
jgi:flagellar motility protein MotE (MotC chaperone)